MIADLVGEAARKQAARDDARITVGARKVRVALQLLIGLLILILILVNACGLLSGLFGLHIAFFSDFSVLKIVGTGLIFSAGVELVYMLFTPGPDEAVDPIILSVAATILLIVSDIHGIQDDHGDRLLKSSFSVFILAVTVGGLFFVRHRFLKPERPIAENDAAASEPGLRPRVDEPAAMRSAPVDTPERAGADPRR